MQKYYKEWMKLGVKIIIIVGQKREAVQKWLTNNSYDFLFLVDESRSVIKMFNVFNPINIDAFRIAHPSMFLIVDQKVMYAYVGENQRDRPTIELTKDILKKLI